VNQRPKKAGKGNGGKASLPADFDAHEIMVNTNTTRTKKMGIAPNSATDFENISFGASPNLPAIRLPTDKTRDEAARKCSEPIRVCL
jgi:hypothetical protein